MKQLFEISTSTCKMDLAHTIFTTKHMHYFNLKTKTTQFWREKNQRRKLEHSLRFVQLCYLCLFFGFDFLQDNGTYIYRLIITFYIYYFRHIYFFSMHTVPKVCLNCQICSTKCRCYSHCLLNSFATYHIFNSKQRVFFVYFTEILDTYST